MRVSNHPHNELICDVYFGRKLTTCDENSNGLLIFRHVTSSHGYIFQTTRSNCQLNCDRCWNFGFFYKDYVASKSPHNHSTHRDKTTPTEDNSVLDGRDGVLAKSNPHERECKTKTHLSWHFVWFILRLPYISSNNKMSYRNFSNVSRNSDLKHTLIRHLSKHHMVSGRLAFIISSWLFFICRSVAALLCNEFSFTIASCKMEQFQ